MTGQTNDRKIQHIQAILDDPQTDRDARFFDRIHLTHRALPEISFNDIDPSISFLGKTLSFPLLISSMTGGDHKLVRTINRNLAIAAEGCGVALAVGSQRVMFTEPESRSSFDLREHAPTAVLIGNVGAVQLNYGFDATQCQQAVDLLQADALYLHLNPLQEAIQPEGDLNFAGLVEKIGSVVEALSVPVLLKEVGSGLSVSDIARAYDVGVRFFDVAGSGGTSWSRIENHRRGTDDLGMLFQDWGIPTPVALDQAFAWSEKTTLIASGGLRNGIDLAKSVILGGYLGGMATPFLQPAMESPDAVVKVIEQIKREYMTAMFLLGVKSTPALKGQREFIIE